VDYQIIDMIRKVSVLVDDDKLNCLTVEEALLVKLVKRNTGVPLKCKKKAFERIAEINKMQLKMLGQVLES